MKFDKFKPYFQAYQLDPQAVFFIGSQIYFKNNKSPQNKLQFSRIFNKTPLKNQKTSFNPTTSFNNFMKNEKKKLFFDEKSPSNDIESLENKGILTWGSQISDDPSENEQEASRNRTEFLSNLQTLIKGDVKTPVSSQTRPQISRKMSQNHQTFSGILRKKEEKAEKGLLTEVSEKMLSFDMNLCEKTPYNNSKNRVFSPVKVKSKSISFSKQSSSPLKKRRLTNEELQRSAKKIQKIYREYSERLNSMMSPTPLQLRPYRIIQHFPSYTIHLFPKKTLQNFENKKQANGSLLIIYVRKNGHIRIIFKNITIKKIFVHIFDFSEVRDEKLRVSLFDEFLIKIFPMLCIFNDCLTLRIFAFSTVKSHKLKINKFILEEIELVSLQETFTRLLIPSLNMPSLDLKLGDMEPLFTKDENILTSSSQNSLRPLINENSYSNKWNDNDIFPLINQIGSLSDLSFVEPLLHNEQINENNESQLGPIMRYDEGSQKEKREIISHDLKSLEGFEINIQKIEKNNEETDEDKENSNKKQERPKKITKEDYVRKIQRSFRMINAIKAFELKKQSRIKLIKRFLLRKAEDFFIDFCIFLDLNQQKKFLKVIFLKKSDNSQSIYTENSLEISEILSEILKFPQPLIWIKFNCLQSKVLLKNPVQIRETLRNFQEAFRKIPNRLLSFTWNRLIRNRAFKRISDKVLISEKIFNKILLNSKRKTLKDLMNWSKCNDFLVISTKKLNRLFIDKKTKIWRTINNKLMLLYKLSEHLSQFSNKISSWMEMIETKRGYLTSFKRIFLFSKFKDCEFLDNRMLYYKKKTIEAYCYFQGEKNNLLIYTLSSEILQYEEKIDFVKQLKRKNYFDSTLQNLNKKTSEKAQFFDKNQKIQQEKSISTDKLLEKSVILSEKQLSNSEKINNEFPEEVFSLDLAAKLQILSKHIRNITLIQDPNSMKLRFKLYPEEYLGSTLRIQSYIYKKLYSKTFEIKDFKSGKIAKGYILLHSSKIHLLLKNFPFLLSSIYEISDEFCLYVRISKKISCLEIFLAQGLHYSPEKQEILFKEENFSRVCLTKTLIIDSNIKIKLLLELDFKAHKLLIRIENDDKFYKIALPSFDIDNETSFEILRNFAEKTLENTVILKEIEGKYRILNDSDPYGPLMYKENFAENFVEKKLQGFVRLIDIKKNFLVIIEVCEGFGMVSLITNTYIPYENDENKRLLSEFLIKGIKNNLTFDSKMGVILKEEFLTKEFEEFIGKTKGISEGLMNKNLRNNSSEESFGTKKEGIVKKNEGFEKKKEVLEKKIESELEKIEENINSEGDIHDCENAALKIQNKYRKKKGQEKKNHMIQENVVKEKKENSKKNVKEEENVVLDGDIADYERAALMIQKKYRAKTPIKIQKNQDNQKKSKETKKKSIELQINQKKLEEKTEKPEKIQTNPDEILKRKTEKASKKEDKELEFVLEGDIKEYENAAKMIQTKYRQKKSLKKQKNSPEKVVLEGNIEDYQKAALKIQSKYRSKKSHKETKSPQTSLIEDSPPKPLMEQKAFILEGDIHDYEKAALKIQEKFRQKHAIIIPTKNKQVSLKKQEIPSKSQENPKKTFHINRFSLIEKPLKTKDSVSDEETDKTLGLNKEIKRRNSFKKTKKNSLFTKFKGRTFELNKQNLPIEEILIGYDENYRIRIFPAPEDLEIAVSYLQEWWREVLMRRKKDERNEIESFLEDIGGTNQK